MRHSKISKQKGRSIKLKETLKFSDFYSFTLIQIHLQSDLLSIMHVLYTFLISADCSTYFSKINLENIKLIKILSVQFLLNLKSKPYRAKLKSQQIIYFPVFMKRGHCHGHQDILYI